MSEYSQIQNCGILLRSADTTTTTSIKRPPHLKTTFWSEQNFPFYFMFDFASLKRPVSY